MKRHLVWFRSAAAAAVAAAGVSAAPVCAQYLPMYGATPQAPPTQQQAQTPVPAYPAARQPGVAPQAGYPVAVQPAQPAYTAYRPQAPTASAAQVPQYPQTGPQYSGYPTYGYPTVAQQTPAGPTTALPPQGETLPAPAAASGAMNGSMNGGMAATPVQNNQGYPTAGCSTCGSGYPSTGCYQGDNYGCNSQGYGLADSFDSCNDSVWFGGVYYLFMERDNGDFNRLAIQVDTSSASYPYYPPASRTILATNDVDYGFNSGAEIRIGSTFTIGSPCDSGCGGYGGCGYGNGCGGCGSCDTYAWEAAYWGLDNDSQVVRVVDQIPTDTYRMYGMKNFAGLQYDRYGTGGWRPVNDYYDYNMPVNAPTAPVDGDIRVLAQRVRTNFQTQNVELNFLRLPMICSSSCGSCGGGSTCGGCDGAAACAPCCGSAFTMTGLCGVRYMRLDDDFEYANKFGEYSGGSLDYPVYTPFDYQSSNELFYDVQVDNHLMGFQLGANMNYCVACKWNFFCDTNFGLYNNYMDAHQRVYSGGGGSVTWTGSGNDASVSSHKDDISFLGELRLGGAYDFTCNWRGVLAYRAVAITGVALSGDQIPQDFANSAEVGRIDSDGSLLIHGFQAGVECRY